MLAALISGTYAQTLKELCDSGVTEMTIGFESENNLDFCKNGECLLSQLDIAGCPDVDFFVGYKLSQVTFPDVDHFYYDVDGFKNAISKVKEVFLPPAAKDDKVAYNGLNIYLDFTLTSAFYILQEELIDHPNIIITIDATTTWAREIANINTEGLKRIVLRAKDAQEFITAVDGTTVPTIPVYVLFTGGNQEAQIKLARETTNWYLSYANEKPIGDGSFFADGFNVYASD